MPHFLWLTCEREQGKPVVRAFLSETPIPDGPEFLQHIARSRITANGRALDWTRNEATYRVNLPEPCPGVVDGECDLGVMSRNGATFRLVYTARAQLGPASARQAEAADHLRMRMVAQPDRAPIVVVSFRGKPAAGAVVKAFPDEGEPVELKADAQGRLDYRPAAEGRAGLLAKWSEKASGERDGKAYDEVRYYATLTVAPAEATAASVSSPAAPFATLPQAVNSFGGAVLGDWLYVYGGHTGKTHKYSRETVSKHFRRLNLRDRVTWEELPCGPPLQGVTLMSHGGRLYRIGGMAPHNSPGQPSDLVSIADFALRSGIEDLDRLAAPPDPAVDPRFRRRGRQDLRNRRLVDEWGRFYQRRVPQHGPGLRPGTRGSRMGEAPGSPVPAPALAVGAVDGKVFAIGGLTEDGKVVKSVDIYDIAARTWSRGPDLPGSKRQGFAPSAFEVGGKLYANGVDGQVLRLSGTGHRWEVAGKLATPRLTHRLLPGIANDLLAVGGSVAGAPIAVIESFPLDGASPANGRP